MQYISTDIACITEDGIETVDGQRRSYDVIVAATGYDTTFIPRFPVIGRNNANLQDVWKEYPATYLGLCQDQHPNWCVTNETPMCHSGINVRCHQVPARRAKYGRRCRNIDPDPRSPSRLHRGLH